MNSVYIKRIASFALSLTISLTTLVNTVFAAPVFSDVENSHWAYQSIIKIADLGIIVGDTEGRYNPNDYIDKFETAKILARISGYKQFDYTESEKAFFDKAYEKNRTYLSQYGKTYKKWNTTTDRQIAYLLEKEILTPDDLKDFVGIKPDGTEGVRALTKEDAAMFITKAVGKKNEALAASLPVLYLDDLKISAAARPYVYYLKSARLMEGDEKNCFNPREAITKADMAVLLDMVFTYTGIKLDKVFETSVSNEIVEAGKIETITATFASFYKTQDMNAVQLVLNDGTKKIYKASPNLIIYVNGFLKTESDLMEGMTVHAVLSNNEIVDIKADTISKDAKITLEEITNTPLLSVNGVVLSTSSDSVVKTIAVEIKVQNPGGEFISEVKSYLLSENCSIIRNGEEALFNDITKGDIISAEVYGAKIHSMKLEQKSRPVEANLVSAKKNKQGTVILTVSGSGKEYELVLENAAIIKRDGVTAVWQDLRTGDLLKMICEYDRVFELEAIGGKDEVLGKLSQIKITSSGSYLTVTGEYGELTYKVIPARVDVYSLRVDSSVILHLDSLEVELVQTIDESKNPRYITGYIVHKRNSSAIINEINGKTSVSTEIYFNDNTVFIDSNTGKSIAYNDIPDTAKIYVFLDESLKKVISVTVL